MRYWLEKIWVQNVSLVILVLGMVYYWGWVFDFGYKFDWSVLYIVNPTYGMNMGEELLKGLQLTIKISLVSSVLALALGTLFGLGRLSNFKPLQIVSVSYVELFRNTPLLIQLFFWYFAFPMVLPDTVRDFIFEHNFEFWSATLGLSVYTGAFMAEVIRAGLQSIPKGLLEAAYSSGLNYVQVLRKVILPLAFRSIIPPLGSEFLNNMKNSSLAMVVGVAELCWQSQQVESLTFKGFEATTAATLLYLMLSLIISIALNHINDRMKVESMAKRTAARFLMNPKASRLLFLWKFREFLSDRRHARRRQAHMLTAEQAARREFLRKVWETLILAGKGFFILLLLGLGYKIVIGLIGFNWDVVFGNLRSLLVWRFPNGNPGELFWGLGGLAYSILMSVIAITVSFFIGLVVGIARTCENRLLRYPAMMYIDVIRGIPLIMVIFWVYFFIPVVFDTFFDVFWSATLALTVFTGAYLAEIVRAGIENIPAGQMEAAIASGLTFVQAMRKVILPQALKQMIPAIVGQFIAIFKDTSLAYVIGVLELTFVAQGLNNRLMIYPFEIYTTVALLYFVSCYSMSMVANNLERRLSPEKVRLQM